jgi:translation initiation factor 3 subunit D
MAKKSGTVYATDNMVSAVMCAARSVYGWDLIVTKRDGALVMDKRSEGNFDLLTVSETAQAMIEDDKDNINGVHKLSEESTRCNFDYSQQVLTEDFEKFGTDADPFGANDASAAKVGYRYRKWNVGDGITLVSRHGLNGVTDDKTGAKALLSIKTLNEFDSKIAGVDYRKQIETQRGAVIATELKNNANKLAKWTCEALLAGADQLKLGFVSRTHPKDPNNHAIVNTQTYKPKDFAQQINLTEGNMWGVFKSVVEMCMKMEDGKYLLVKDANKPILRTYIVGDGEFNDDYASEPINGH